MPGLVVFPSPDPRSNSEGGPRRVRTGLYVVLSLVSVGLLVLSVLVSLLSLPSVSLSFFWSGPVQHTMTLKSLLLPLPRLTVSFFSICTSQPPYESRRPTFPFPSFASQLGPLAPPTSPFWVWLSPSLLSSALFTTRQSCPFPPFLFPITLHALNRFLLFISLFSSSAQRR